MPLPVEKIHALKNSDPLASQIAPASKHFHRFHQKTTENPLFPAQFVLRSLSL